MPSEYLVCEVRTTYENVRQRWPEVIPTEDSRKTQPPDWKWYYTLQHGVVSSAARKRLGKRPITRARNLFKRSSSLWVVAKIGGSEVFGRTVVEEPAWRAGLDGKLPDEIIELFIAAQG